MANSLIHSPYIIDTAAADMVSIVTLTIQAIRWVGATTAGHTAVIQDADGRVLWSGIAGTTNWDEESRIPHRWPGGFKVPTLASGILYIYLDDLDR